MSLVYIELSRKNLIHNFKQLKKIAKPGTEIAAVIKGNAYGHGQNEIAKILEPYADYFQVNSFSELKLLRKVSKKKTFVLGYVEQKDLKEAMKLGCILSVFSIEILREIEKVARKLKIRQEIHMPIDAYLGREGFCEGQWVKFFETIKKCRYIKLGGIYAHFANIEDTADFSHAERQIRKHAEAVKLAESFGLKKLQNHISATSGLLVYEKNKGLNSVVRLGVGIYGLWPSEHIKRLYSLGSEASKLELRPVMAWKTKIAQIKTLPAGHPIGYGLTYLTSSLTKIAVIPTGYADGFPRSLSNKGEVLIGGTHCPVLGRVAMNMFVVDVNHLKRVEAEDEVVILGRQGGEEITAEEIAERADTLNYEIITHISPLIPRIIVK